MCDKVNRICLNQQESGAGKRRIIVLYKLKILSFFLIAFSMCPAMFHWGLHLGLVDNPEVVGLIRLMSQFFRSLPHWHEMPKILLRVP